MKKTTVKKNFFVKEQLEIAKEWIEKYETVKHLLVAPMNYAEVFEKNEIHGKNYLF